MKSNRGWLIGGSIILQIASWFDTFGWLSQYFPLRPLTNLQAAQVVGSSVLLIVFLSFGSNKSSTNSPESE